MYTKKWNWFFKKHLHFTFDYVKIIINIIRDWINQKILGKTIIGRIINNQFIEKWFLVDGSNISNKFISVNFIFLIQFLMFFYQY